MPKLYCDANPRSIAYYLDGGDSNYQELPIGYSSMEAEYLAIIYGLNEYFLKWNKELDARYSDENFNAVGTPSDRTKRHLPPAVLVLNDNEVVVKQLSREYHIGNDKLRKLAQQVWNMTKNVEVKFQWISRKENLAGKMLK